MTTVDEMQEVLQGFGVDLANPQWLREKALALVAANIEPDEAERLFRHIERTTSDPDHVPGAVAALALDPARVREGIRGLATFGAAGAQRSSSQPAPPRPAPVAGEDPRDWARRRNRAIAFARVVSDRQPLPAVAEELGLHPQVVKQLVEEERATLRTEAVQAGRRMIDHSNDVDEARRREKFLSDMRAARGKA